MRTEWRDISNDELRAKLERYGVAFATEATKNREDPWWDARIEERINPT